MVTWKMAFEKTCFLNLKTHVYEVHETVGKWDQDRWYMFASGIETKV